MKASKVFFVVALVFVFVGFATAQEKMTKDEWEQEVNKYTHMRDELKTKSSDLTTQISQLQSNSTRLDGDVSKCTDELYSLVGSDAQKATAYRTQIDAAERSANELNHLSDTELSARSADAKDLDTKVKALHENKLSLIPEFSDRLDALDKTMASLDNTMSSMAQKSYTVGNWSENRDCLWNIAAKQDIYNNAWLWPKIWMSNTDKITNPDIISQGEVLTIPAGTELTADEKAAADKYYARKNNRPATLERKTPTTERKSESTEHKPTSSLK